MICASHGPIARTQQQGFTLVELLVVMTLLSLVMLAMGSALRTTAQTEERIDQRLQRADEMRVANGFLREILGRLSARKKATPTAVGENPFIFSGQSDALRWVGIMPARYGAGGRYHFWLRLEGDSAGSALVLRYAPWVDDSIAPDWEQAESYGLVVGTTALSIQYEDASVEPPLWTDHWASPDRLPQRVMLQVQTANGLWPDVVIALRMLPGSNPDSNRPSFGRSQ
ncbi:MAG: prepilin-type N-terminal cleavage/methylation domain-containing protein [Giesbergeria sp.]|nr:prepilin-type N-terminal cleavage/methylation domain-containing protein [Giesbergeria sp.]